MKKKKKRNSKNQRQDWLTTVGIEINLAIMRQWTNNGVDDDCKSASSNHTNQAANIWPMFYKYCNMFIEILSWHKVLRKVGRRN